MDTKGLSTGTLVLLIVVPILLIAVGAVVLIPSLIGSQPQVTSQGTTALTSATTTANSGNAQNSSWSKYLGYIPQGYTLASKQSNAPNFPCPTGMNTAQCQQFRASCGNGVCDPNETCSS